LERFEVIAATVIIANPVEDWTIEAMKFLSCGSLQRTIWDELHYRRAVARKQKILQYGHHNLSTYGIGKDKVQRIGGCWGDRSCIKV